MGRRPYACNGWLTIPWGTFISLTYSPCIAYSCESLISNDFTFQCVYRSAFLLLIRRDSWLKMRLGTNHTVTSKIYSIFLSLSHDFWVTNVTTLCRTLRLSTWIKAVQPSSSWFSLVPTEKFCKCKLKKRLLSFPSTSLPTNHPKSYPSIYAVKKQLKIINWTSPFKLLYSTYWCPY